jgi:formylglycine-generating enzyme required for sulfatase activity
MSSFAWDILIPLGLVALASLISTPPPRATDMLWIPGGEFTMGTDSDWAWPEEKPARRVRVGGFWMDRTEVTNEEFAAFVRATGYVTTAERAQPPGSLVFRPPSRSAGGAADGWSWTLGADWRHPLGPGSGIEGKERHPVVQVSWDDAAAYARWCGKRLPTEAEWEFAARGGLDGRTYVWGDDVRTDGRCMANTWQGCFPAQNGLEDGFFGTAPVASFPPNGFGLYDMAGNVWEWCGDRFDRTPLAQAVISPVGPLSLSEAEPRSQRGGSFLCSESGGSRYRPESRQGCAPGTGKSDVGFRCVRSGRPGL